MVSCWQSWTWPPVMANTFVAYAMLCMFVYINTDVFSPWHSSKQAWLLLIWLIENVRINIHNWAQKY